MAPVLRLSAAVPLVKGFPISSLHLKCFQVTECRSYLMYRICIALNATCACHGCEFTYTIWLTLARAQPGHGHMYVFVTSADMLHW